MKLITRGHLTYCSNIHPGESWEEVFQALQTHLPVVKKQVSPEQSMGIGLRLSDQASRELQQEGTTLLNDWMHQQGFYVFTMNGFPFGGFHRQKVKDQVHQPDWTTSERVAYTLRLFEILSQLIPKGLDGGISTSPLSYKPWWSQQQRKDVFRRSTQNIIEVLVELHKYYQDKEVLLHLDIEPEPDGLIENSQESITYFREWLLPMAQEELVTRLGVSVGEAKEIALRHINICYDVCHFAVAYESPAEVMQKFQESGIRIGKIQISSALKKDFTGTAESRDQCKLAFSVLNEPTYLHQVIARDREGGLHQYTDLPAGLNHIGDPEIVEWRTHFHVPVFVRSYGLLESTQQDIIEVLQLWSDSPMTNHLEVETYTWEVLPRELQKELNTSIARELNWVIDQMDR